MTAIASTSSTAARRPGRAASVALWVGQILVAASLLFASVPKVTLDPMAVEGFAAIGFSATGTLIIGLLEIAGAIGLLVPRLTGLAALCTVALMIGAVIVTVVFMGAALAVLPALIGVIAALVAYGRRHTVVELAAWVRTRR
ncbi:DoxX family protein [Pseudonocardia sp. KRD291]|uniref:DoxX family protein n=1 Tax=Pseudonocardia sp. KRD291 TaxID=2792007 RepID=UPI001C4A2637|nr:DoxX family protein [Pseudonocardia sp. KRD291]MBW0104910.1 DoxX family protein [Pseudonocardia sp. KRD291]